MSTCVEKLHRGTDVFTVGSQGKWQEFPRIWLLTASRVRLACDLRNDRRQGFGCELEYCFRLFIG
jgi:hypothetical protein